MADIVCCGSKKVKYPILVLVSIDPGLTIANHLSLKSNSCCWKMTGSPGQTRPLMWINMSSSWEKICKLIFFQIPVGIWWHWVGRGHYLLVLGGNGTVLDKGINAVLWFGESFISLENLLSVGRILPQCVFATWYRESVISPEFVINFYIVIDIGGSFIKS